MFIVIFLYIALIIVVTGATVGYIGSRITKRNLPRTLFNMFIGIVGAILSFGIFSYYGFHLYGGLGVVLQSFVGAFLLLSLPKIFER